MLSAYVYEWREGNNAPLCRYGVLSLCVMSDAESVRVRAVSRRMNGVSESIYLGRAELHPSALFQDA